MRQQFNDIGYIKSRNIKEMFEEMVEWKDVEDFMKWWESDNHDFDIAYNKANEPIGYINVKFGGSYYTLKEFFDYYIKYVKE